MTIDSPCTKICTLDPASGLCLGCGRTLAEIARWAGLDDAQRAAVMRGLAGRLAEIERRHTAAAPA